MEIILSEELTRLMKAQNLSVASLARETEIPRTTIHDWVNGRKPSAANIHHLATLTEYFEVSLTELLFGDKDGTNRSKVLFSSSFNDNTSRYKITIEKLKK